MIEWPYKTERYGYITAARVKAQVERWLACNRDPVHIAALLHVGEYAVGEYAKSADSIPVSVAPYLEKIWSENTPIQTAPKGVDLDWQGRIKRRPGGRPKKAGRRHVCQEEPRNANSRRPNWEITLASGRVLTPQRFSIGLTLFHSLTGRTWADISALLGQSIPVSKLSHWALTSYHTAPHRDRALLIAKKLDEHYWYKQDKKKGVKKMSEQQDFSNGNVSEVKGDIINNRDKGKEGDEVEALQAKIRELEESVEGLTQLSKLRMNKIEELERQLEGGTPLSFGAATVETTDEINRLRRENENYRAQCRMLRRRLESAVSLAAEMMNRLIESSGGGGAE